MRNLFPVRLFGAWAGVCLLVLAALLTSNPAQAKRVALVIGSDVYQNLPILQKAVNDARAISDTLKGIGFTVIKGENLTRRQMNRRLSDLERAISPGDQVFFFFAGHGVALGATNYLIPADMPLPEPGEESLVRGEAFAVDAIVERIQSRGAAASFIVLDACRNNPFKTRGVRAIGSSRGLRDISAPKGVFVLFSAGIGQLALDRLNDDDPNPNSVFTRKLVPLLKTPGLSHVRLAKTVQSQVDKLARTVGHEQQPAYYDQVIGDMFLVEDNAPRTPVLSNSVSAETGQGGGYVVQISSHVTLEAAEAAYENLSRRFAGIFGGRQKDIKKVTIEGKGTFYRVLIPIGSELDAVDFCGRYKSAGGSCFVTR